MPTGSVSAPSLLFACTVHFLCSSKRRLGTAPPQFTGNFCIGFTGSSNKTSCACNFRCVPWEFMLGFIQIKAEAGFAGGFQGTHYLWGERNLKNSLIYHVKKRWHIYCYINVIYIVFSVTLTEIFLNFLLLVGKVYQQYLEIWHRVQICNKPTMETGEQDEKQFISDN